MKKAIVVDLDGTLFTTNTFKHYIVFVVKNSLYRLDVWTAFIVSLFVLLRKIRLLSTHEEMKFLILRNTAIYSISSKMRHFVDSLKKYENKSVLNLIEEYRNKGYTTVLSTAAPKNYAMIVASDYGFDCFCSTEMPKGGEWRENFNEQKKKNTFDLLNALDCDLSVFVTDHYDDLPLLRIPKERNYLIYPSSKTKLILDENKIEYSLL